MHDLTVRAAGLRAPGGLCDSRSGTGASSSSRCSDLGNGTAAAGGGVWARLRDDYVPPGYYPGPEIPGDEMNELRLCHNTRLHPRTHSRWPDCPQDPTCKQCVPTYRMQCAQEMLATVWDIGQRQLRADLITRFVS